MDQPRGGRNECVMVLRGRIYLFALFASLFAAVALIGFMADKSRAQDAITPPSELEESYVMRWEKVADGNVVVQYVDSQCMHDRGSDLVILTDQKPSYSETIKDSNSFGELCRNGAKRISWWIRNLSSVQPFCQLFFVHKKEDGWQTQFGTTCMLEDPTVKVTATCNGVDCLNIPYPAKKGLTLKVTFWKDTSAGNRGAFSTPSNGAQLYSVSQFSGSCSVTGGQVWLGLNGKRFQASMQSGGNWVYNPTDPDFNRAGSHTVTLHDAASGGTQLASVDYSIVTVTPPEPAKEDTGSFFTPSEGEQLTYISRFNGATDAADVWLEFNGTRYQASVQGGGSWYYTPSDPGFNAKGSHYVALYNARSGGKKLDDRNYTIIEVTPPEPVKEDRGAFTAPSNGAKLQSISQFSGTSDVAGGKVWLELSDRRYEASMQSGGDWVYKPSDPDFNRAGTHQVKLYNSGSAGKELASRDYTITDKGAIQEPSAGAELLSISQFSGTSDVAGGKVWLELSGRRYEATMQSGGNWIYKPSDPGFSSVGTHTVTLYNAASGGDNLDSRTYYIGKPMAITAPAANVMIDSKPGSTVPITGTGFPGVSYSLSLDKTNSISIDDPKVVPDQNGNWSRQIRIASDAAQKVTGWYLEATLTRTGGRAQLDAATVLADEPPVKKRFAIELENLCRINNREYRGSSQTITMAPGPVRIEGLTMEQSVVSLAQIIAWDDGLKATTRAHEQYQDGFWTFEGDGAEPQINLQIGDYPFQITTRPRVEGFIGADNLICSGTIVVR